MAEKRKEIKGRGRDVGIPPVREDLTVAGGDTAADERKGADALDVEGPRARLSTAALILCSSLRVSASAKRQRFVLEPAELKDVGMKLRSRRMVARRGRDQ